MKRIYLVVVCMLSFALPAAADMGTDFRDHFRADALAHYNRDVSVLMGQADFHTGKGTTFPGFDLGATVSAVKTSGDNFSGEKYLYVPFLTAETQLPVLGLGVAVRGTQYNGFRSLGGGLKWHGSLALINFSAAAFYDRGGTDYYDTDHYSASAAASVNVLFFTPYVGVGYDYSTLKVKDMGAASGQKSDDGAMRYTAGINFHPLPFFYVYGAYTYSQYSQGFQGGLGLHF